MLTTKAVGVFLHIKNVAALQKELRNYYTITNELSTSSGNLAFKCGRLLVVANTVLITTKHIDFDRVKAIKTEELPRNAEQLPSG